LQSKHVLVVPRLSYSGDTNSTSRNSSITMIKQNSIVEFWDAAPICENFTYFNFNCCALKVRPNFDGFLTNKVRLSTPKSKLIQIRKASVRNNVISCEAVWVCYSVWITRGAVSPSSAVIRIHIQSGIRKDGLLVCPVFC
jgi:hypothetical protein